MPLRLPQHVAVVSILFDLPTHPPGRLRSRVTFDHVLSVALTVGEFLLLLLLEGRKGEEELPLGIPLEECAEEVVSYRGGEHPSTV